MECREVVALPHSKANENYCANLRAEILGRIAKGVFRYDDYFPQSSRAAVFGHSGKRKDSPLKEILEAYRTHIKGQVEATTFKSYSNDIDVLIGDLGHIQVGGLTRQAVRDWIVRKGLGLKRTKNLLVHLRAVFDEARDDGVIDASPLDGVKLRRIIPIALRATDYEPSPYSEADLLAVLRNLPEPERWAFQLWAYTGLRTSELIGLRWARVDLAKGRLTVQEVTVNGIDKGRPKTPGSVRTLDLLPAALEAVERMHSLGFGGERFTTNPRARKRSSWDLSNLADAWLRGHYGTGVNPRPPYQLRHTFASNMLSQGENLAQIAAYLGHTGTAMVVNVYGRWVSEGEGFSQTQKSRAYGQARLWDSHEV